MIAVSDMKRFFKWVASTICLTIITVGAFLAGGIGYKQNQYQKIPGATHLLNILKMINLNKKTDSWQVDDTFTIFKPAP